MDARKNIAITITKPFGDGNDDNKTPLETTNDDFTMYKAHHCRKMMPSANLTMHE